MATKGYKSGSVREELHDEAMSLLENYPFLGAPRFSTLLERLLQEWIAESWELVYKREAALAESIKNREKELRQQER